MPRRRTTTDSKVRGGSFRPSTARDDVQLPPGVPRAPDWLEREAKQEWTRVVRDLSEAGALAKAHRSTLVIYCTLWGEFEKAHGAVPTARLAELRRLSAELGISPRASTVRPESAQRSPRPSAADAGNPPRQASLDSKVIAMAERLDAMGIPRHGPKQESKP